MKIVLNSVEDLRDLIGVMDPEFLRTWQPALERQTVMLQPDAAGLAALREAANSRRGTRVVSANVAQAAGLTDEPEGLPADIAQPVRAASDNPQDDEKVCTVQADADGVAHNADWHSDPAKINADGRWRARRKRDEDAYKAWLLEQAVEVAEAAVAADAEPVATETHALPQAEPETAGDAPEVQAEPETAGDAAPTVDLTALVEASQEAALDASDSHMDLIKACQAFISDHGHPAYNTLKAAVAPLEGAENGKAVPQFTPGERRLMRACIDNYPKP